MSQNQRIVTKYNQEKLKISRQKYDNKVIYVTINFVAVYRIVLSDEGSIQ
jgi:hypothetical protein